MSFVIGVVKPSGITSHDVVAKVRRILGERRVGHSGTLDPFATGVLPILVGPATRLDKYLSDHAKSYVAEIEFGTSTTTDDRCGDVIHEGQVSECAADSSFAEEVLDSFKGQSMQMPPAYSAIKVDGKKACDEARKGNIINLEPRPIEVHSARLLNIEEIGGHIVWRVALHVSKGTYIRALARDIGKRVGTPAHLRELERDSVDCIGLEDCTPLSVFEATGKAQILDPIALLGMRVVFAGEGDKLMIGNGRVLDACNRRVHCRVEGSRNGGCSCMAPFIESSSPFQDGERVALVYGNELLAIYRFEKASTSLKPDCVFQQGVSRGGDI